MRIISKYKDYYDYLSGIYGIDNKLILDRRTNTNSPYLSDIGVNRLYIAGYIVEFLYIKHKFYYGESLKQFYKSKRNYLTSKHWKRDYDKSIYITQGINKWIYTEPIKDKDNINIKEDCPILIDTIFGLKKYPILSKFNLASFIVPKVIYRWLEEYLSARITDKETHLDTRNDINKLQDKGFNKKYSFRPKIKK